MANGLIQSALKGELEKMGLVGAQNAESQSLFAKFLLSLFANIEQNWDNDEDWEDSRAITKSLSFGSVQMLALGAETTSPKELIEAVISLLEDKSETIEKLFPQGQSELAFKELKEAKNAHGSDEVLKHLENFFDLLTERPEADEVEEKELPANLERTLENEREEAKEQEEAFAELLLGETIREVRDNILRLETLQAELNRVNTPLPEAEARKLSELRSAAKEAEQFVADAKKQRGAIIETQLLPRPFISKDKLSRPQAHVTLFLEHSIEGYEEAEDKEISAAATEYWQYLVERAKEISNAIDPAQTFTWSVLQGFQDLIEWLRQLNTRLKSPSEAVKKTLLAALGKEDSETPAAPETPGGGESDTPGEGQNFTPDEDAWNKEWSKILLAIELLDRDFGGRVSLDTTGALAATVGQLSRLATQLWDTRIPVEGSLESLFQTLRSFAFLVWARQKESTVVDESLAVFQENIIGARQVFEAAPTPQDTPGQAAAKAQAAAEEQPVSEPTTAPDDSSPASQLKDLGKLTHAQATLTAVTLSLLEEELRTRYPNLTEAQIQQFLDDNRSSIAQMVWNQYLGVITGQTTAALDSTLIAKIAVSTSQFFVEQHSLDSFARTTALTGADANRGFEDGAITPELETKLQQLALANGYRDLDELLLSMFGENLSPTEARERFFRLAQQSSSLNSNDLTRLSGDLIRNHLEAGSDPDRAVAGLLDILSKDRQGLEAFLIQYAPDELSNDRRNKLMELSLLAIASQRQGDLSPRDQARFNTLLKELAPLLQLYTQYGESFYGLRFGIPDLNQYTATLSQYAQYESELIGTWEEEDPAGAATYQRFIPVFFLQPQFVQLAEDEAEQETLPGQSLPSLSERAHLPMVTAMARQNQAALERISQLENKQAIKAQRAVARKAYADLAQWQRAAGHRGALALERRAGGKAGGAMRDVGRLLGKGNGKGLFGSLGKSKPAMMVIRGVVSAVGGAVGSALASAAALIGPWLPVILPVAGLVMGAIKLFGGASSGAAAATSASGSFMSSEVATGLAEGGKTAASNLGMNAKALGQQALSNTSQFASQLGTSSTGFITAVTTQASTSAVIVVGGLISPILFMIVMTFIVWAVIGNSFNDYNNSNPLARRVTGLARCWPAEGVIKGLRTYEDGERHGTSDFGTAIDIAKGGPNLPVFSPYSGTATQQFDPGGYGLYVRVRTTEGFDLLFGHLNDALVSPQGDTVVAGQQIGVMGSTGNSTGQHLHYELIDIQQKGLEVFDITPLSEAQLRFNMVVTFAQCVQTGQLPSPQPATPSGTTNAPRQTKSTLATVHASH